MIRKWDIYGTQVIRNKMLLNKKYPEQLMNKCRRFSDRWNIDIHDALHHIISSGEIDRVAKNYRATGRI